MISSFKMYLLTKGIVFLPFISYAIVGPQVVTVTYDVRNQYFIYLFPYPNITGMLFQLLLCHNLLISYKEHMLSLFLKIIILVLSHRCDSCLYKRLCF